MLNMLPSAQKMRAEIHCEEEKLKHLLRRYQLRPTKQRLVIASCLFKRPKRHIHADMLYEEIAAAGEDISVATIYNSLRCFCRAGLIRVVPSRDIRQWFCTDIHHNCQFYFDNGEHIEPIENWSEKNMSAFNLPNQADIPAGYKISHVDISIHLEQIPN